MTGEKTGWRTAVRTAIVIGLLIGFVSLALAGGQWLSLDALAQREQALRSVRDQHPVLVVAAAFLTYTAMTGASVPGASFLSVFLGWYLGWIGGVAVVSFGSTAGATIAFLLSRTVLRERVTTRFADRWSVIESNFQRDGASYLFALRLTPVVPFFVINLLMGLTPIRVWTFWWVSQVGMLPATMLYVYAGAQFPTLAALADRGVAGIVDVRLLIALMGLGLSPWAFKAIARSFHRTSD